MYKLITKNEVFKDPTLKFRVDSVISPEGEIVQRKIIEYHNSAAVVAFSNKNKVPLYDIIDIRLEGLFGKFQEELLKRANHLKLVQNEN